MSGTRHPGDVSAPARVVDVVPCRPCNGRGEIITGQRCRPCNGSGHIEHLSDGTWRAMERTA